MNIAGNTMLITDGTSGIGHGLALRFHEAGNKVIIAGRRKDLLDNIAADRDGIEAVVDPVAYQPFPEANHHAGRYLTGVDGPCPAPSKASPGKRSSGWKSPCGDWGAFSDRAPLAERRNPRAP